MNCSHPQVSVIISAYNHEKYVVETIRSIINQTFQSLELLIIDDGSSDDTWNKILSLKSECEKRFIRFFFQRQENKGTCFTINKLLSKASGKYIYGIASDDIADKNAIKLFYHFLDKNPDYALVVGENGIIDQDSIHCFWDENKNNVYDANIAKYKSFSEYLEKNNPAHINFDSSDFGRYETLLMGNYIPNGYLIRKTVYEKIGPFPIEAPLEDFWLMLQIAKHYKMKFLRQKTFFYRWHATNTIRNAERMDEIGSKTYKYECDLLFSEQYSDLYNKTVKYFHESYKKNIVDLKWLKIYKTRSIMHKFLCIKFINLFFKIKYKRISI